MRDQTTAGPSPEAFGGSSLGAKARRAFFAMRPKFFTASILPVIVGTTLGAKALGYVDWLPAIVAVVATVLVHAAANVLNDVGDDITGADPANTGRIYPYTGGSRFIQAGILTRAEMSRLGLSLLAVAFLLGLWLAAIAGPMVIWLGLAGIAIGVLYSLPRIYLSGKGLGELAVFIAFGPLPVCGAAWLQDGVWDLGRLLISLPVGMWTAAILLINEVPDLESDAAAGKRTLVVRFGVGGAKATYLVMHAIGCAGALAAAAMGALPGWFAAAAVALLALGVKAGLGIASVDGNRARLQKSIETTLAIQAIGSLALVATIALAG